MTQPFKSKEYFILAVIILFFIIPQLTSAEGKIADGKLCVELPKFKTSIESALSERGQKLGLLKDDRIKNLNSAWAKEVADKDTERKEADEKRLAHFASLTNKAKTDADRATIESFKIAVETAVAERRAAIDDAFQDYKTGVSALLETRMKNVGTLKSTYAKSLETAFANASVSCNKRTTPATIREKIKGNLKDLEVKYQDNKKTSIDVSTEMGALAKTRRESIEQAETEFKKAIALASSELNIAH